MRSQTIALLFFGAMPLGAQWLNYRTPGTPRNKDGKPKLPAPAPRSPNGMPDLGGRWQTDSAPAEMAKRLIPYAANAVGEEPLSQHFINTFTDVRPEEIPLRQAAPD